MHDLFPPKSHAAQLAEYERKLQWQKRRKLKRARQKYNDVAIIAQQVTLILRHCSFPPAWAQVMKANNYVIGGAFQRADKPAQHIKRKYTANEMMQRHRQRQRDYYHKNRDKVRAYNREYYHENREKRLEYIRQYRKRRREEELEQKVERHQESHKQRLEYMREYRKKNRSKVRAYDREYRRKKKLAMQQHIDIIAQ